jgi:hypothetical protein
MARKKQKPETKMTEEHKEIDPTLETINLQIELAKAKLELEELRSKTKAISSRPIDEIEQGIIDRQITRGNEDKAVKEKIRSQKAYDNVPVTGKFMNRRAPGQMAKLTYQKYEDDPVKWYEFYDGKTYTIPRGFADQINEHYHTPVFMQKTGPIEDPDMPGSQIAEVDTSNKKYAFVGLAYT